MTPARQAVLILSRKRLAAVDLWGVLAPPRRVTGNFLEHMPPAGYKRLQTTAPIIPPKPPYSTTVDISTSNRTLPVGLIV
jgi:hypothetical protein